MPCRPRLSDSLARVVVVDQTTNTQVSGGADASGDVGSLSVLAPISTKRAVDLQNHKGKVGTKKTALCCLSSRRLLAADDGSDSDGRGDGDGDGDAVCDCVVEGSSVVVKGGSDVDVETSIVATTGSVTVSSGTTLSINGDVSAGADVSLRSDGNGGLVVNDVINAEGNVDIQSRAADTVINGALEAGVDVSVSSGADLLVDGSITAGGSIKANCEELLSNLPKEFRALDDLDQDEDDIGGSFSAGASLSVFATGSIEAYKVVVIVKDDTGLVAGTDATFSGSIESGGRVTIDAGADMTVDGTVTAGADVSMRSDGNGGLIVNDVIEAVGDVSLRSDGNGGLVVNDVINAEGNVDIQSRAADTVINGALEAGVDVSVSSGADLLVDGSITASGSVTANCQDFISNLPVLGRRRALDDLDQDEDDVGGSLSAGASMSVKASRNIEAYGVVVIVKDDTELVATSGSIALSGSVKTGGSLQMDSPGGFALAEGFTAEWAGYVGVANKDLLSSHESLRLHAGERKPLSRDDLDDYQWSKKNRRHFDVSRAEEDEEDRRRSLRL